MPASRRLAPFLDRQPAMILDGGLATELERRGHDLTDALWSARLLVEAPHEIRRLHLDYLRAGADCIVTASYQATFAGFARRGVPKERAARLLRRSVELAREAREQLWAEPAARRGRIEPLVAASIGPYGAYLADGSEYRGDYGLDRDELARFHRRRWRVLAAAGADLLACESIPSAPEALALADLLAETPAVEAWFSFTCRDGERISDGTPLAPLAQRLAARPRVVAIGVNCTSPQHLPALIRSLAKAVKLPIVVYPNSGERWNAAARRWESAAPPFDLAAAGPEWHRLGARLIGGCCRIGPRQIRRLRRAMLGEST